MMILLLSLFFFNHKLAEETTDPLDKSDKAGVHVNEIPLCKDIVPFELQQVI